MLTVQQNMNKSLLFWARDEQVYPAQISILDILTGREELNLKGCRGADFPMIVEQT
jgi:hypothetical protein